MILRPESGANVRHVLYLDEQEVRMMTTKPKDYRFANIKAVLGLISVFSLAAWIWMTPVVENPKHIPVGVTIPVGYTLDKLRANECGGEPLEIVHRKLKNRKNKKLWEIENRIYCGNFFLNNKYWLYDSKNFRKLLPPGEEDWRVYTLP